MVTAKKRRPDKQPVAARPLAALEVGQEIEITAPEKPLRPGQCKKHLQKTVAAAYREIVAGFVEQAKGGSCQHLKMATEVLESAKRMRPGPRVKGPSELMLEELERELG
jgi:hypothetical protein